MSLEAVPSSVAVDATALLILTAPPNRTVAWAIDGPGTLTVLDARTNEAGRALAVYHPAAIGDTVTISATYGAAS